jgi:chromate reductase, NAD(P)H dehydrogenase (quinone)
MPVPKILVIPGSLRSDSPNSRLAALAAKELVLADAEVTRISLIDYPLPLFDAEASADHELLPNAVQLHRMLAAHRGVFITSPEYSASVTPLLKNTIDWLSRSRARGEPNYTVFKDRIFAIGAAATSPGGAAHALMALRQILELGCGALVLPEQINITNADQAFDDMDNLRDEDLAVDLKMLARRLVELARGMA